MGFMDSLKKKNFVVCADIDPPKGTDTAGLFRVADALKGRVDALIVNDMPSAVMTMGALAASYLLKQRGMETIYNILCRDRNILALQSDILSASALGLENIFISSGDDITFGDHPQARPVNELNDDELLAVLAKMEEGIDAGGNKLSGGPRFTCGVTVNVSSKDPDGEIKKMEERMKLGADFFITKPVFEIKPLEKFVKKAGAPVIAEVLILKSVATARYINKHIDGIHVPDEFIDRLYSAGDKQKESIGITAQLINEIKGLCSGVNIKAMGWEDKIPSYLDVAGM